MKPVPIALDYYGLLVQHEVLRGERVDLLAALHLAADALDAYSDVNDGQDGPTPNTAMAALQEIDAVIAKAEGKPR